MSENQDAFFWGGGGACHPAYKILVPQWKRAVLTAVLPGNSPKLILVNQTATDLRGAFLKDVYDIPVVLKKPRTETFGEAVYHETKTEESETCVLYLVCHQLAVGLGKSHSLRKAGYIILKVLFTSSNSSDLLRRNLSTQEIFGEKKSHSETQVRNYQQRSKF